MKSLFRITLLIPIVILVGCYTQFITLETRVDSITSSSSDDSTITSEEPLEKKIDTIIIKEREVCYWRRTFQGEWKLHCYKTNYSDYWYSYYNRPWWYHQSFVKSYYCHCPFHLTFHPNCPNCWFHCDKLSNTGHPYTFKKNYIHHKNNIESTTGKKTPLTNNAPAVKPKVKGPGKSGGRTKQGTIIVGEKPKQGATATAHIPQIPDKPIKEKQTAGVKSDLSLGKVVVETKTDTLVSDTAKIDSTNETILIKPTPGKRGSKRR